MIDAFGERKLLNFSHEFWSFLKILKSYAICIRQEISSSVMNLQKFFFTRESLRWKMHIFIHVGFSHSNKQNNRCEWVMPDIWERNERTKDVYVEKEKNFHTRKL